MPFTFVAVLLTAALVIGGFWLGRHSDSGHQAGQESHATRSSSPAPSPVRVAPSPSRVKPSASPKPSPTRSGPPIEGPYGSLQRTANGSVALTFDDGPDPQWTPAMLDLLRGYGVKATFCLIGENVKAHPELVRRIVAEGHTLCNHTWAHEIDLGEQSPDVIRDNLQRTNDEIRRAMPGAVIRYFRHPGGNWTPAAVEVAASMGMTSLHWDVDPQDWALPGAGAIVTVVDNETQAGSIVLMHDGGGDRSGTVAACRSIVPELRSRFTLAPMPLPQPPLAAHRID